ncbi:hypothetical protein [Flavobacterium chryseum]|uniref:hypothetical protein n=1 Tax=Flavobacterium sp. P3160 TaxID=2512113 RepID=UPI001FB5DD9C|nr:hypothetical protein [Flavobacterium sp. P3160]
MVPYKSHYACFNCRKTFKRRLINDIKRGEKSVLEAKCPQCAELMANMGLDFESPKKDDLKKWEHIKSLYSVGIGFHSCGCSGPGYIPNSKEKLIEYFDELRGIYLKNIDFWRSRIEPANKQEKDKDYQKNWLELGKVSSNSKKEIVKNQQGIIFWLEKVKEIESKISLIK